MTSRARTRRLLAAALLLSATACGSGPPDRTDRGPSSSSAPTLERDDPRVLLWSAPLHYHGVEIRLELPPGAVEQSARIESLEDGDRLVAGDLSIAHRLARFEVAGRGRYRLVPGSRVFVFRPPSREAPWETTHPDRFALVWIGNEAGSPVVREDRPDGSVVWHFGRASVEWAGAAEIVLRNRDEEREFGLPVTLLLGASGEVLESRPAVR